MSLSQLVGIIALPFRRWPRRHAPKRPPIEVLEHYRAAQISGEWWLLASDGTRLLAFGDNESRCRQAASNFNRNIANRRTIRAHVQKTFTHMPL